MALAPIEVKQAPLSDYILRAEALEVVNPPTRRDPLFKPAPNVSPPTLRSDRKNRILVYPGCFNPPHHGHIALLWRTFLCTDDHTIATLIVPMDDANVARKAATEGSGKSFILTHYQRSQLWQDPILNRFAWVYPGDLHDYTEFRTKVAELAAADGFRLNFVTCYGSDHFEDGRVPGSRSVATSDVTRAVEFVSHGGRRLKKLDDCRPWKKMRKASRLQWEGEPPGCWPCWPCRKMRGVVPEFFEAGLDHASLAGSGDFKAILQRCHLSQGTIWWCSKKTDTILSLSLEDGSWYVIFVPSGRTYAPPTSSSSSPIEISATTIRKLYLDTTKNKETIRTELAKFVPNHELLAIYLGLNNSCTEMGNRIVKDEAVTEKAKDDLRVGS